MDDKAVRDQMEALRYRASKMAVQFGAATNSVQQATKTLIELGEKMQLVLSEIDELTGLTADLSNPLALTTLVTECQKGEKVVVLMGNNRHVTATVVDPGMGKVSILGEIYFAQVCHRPSQHHGEEGHN